MCARGAVALPAGRRLQPQDLSMAAALGLAELPVRRRVRVAIFSTGDEIVEPGAPLPRRRALRCEPRICCAGCWRGSAPR